MRATVSISGLTELDAGLKKLSKSTQRSVLTRVLKAAAKPIEGGAKSLAPVDEGDLRASIQTIVVRDNAGKRAFAAAMKGGATRSEAAASARLANRASAGTGASALVRVQATAPHAHLVEFGTQKMTAQPYMGPTARSRQTSTVSGIKTDLGREIDKAAARAMKRARKKAGL